MSKTKNPRRNRSGNNIEDRIQSGMTKFFEYKDREKAIRYAKDKRSYVEDCFIDRELVGYTVPK
jgi:hypothetical protein